MLDKKDVKEVIELVGKWQKSLQSGSSTKYKGAPQEHENKHLWDIIAADLEILIWAIVNDGMVTDDEICLMMTALSAHGVPNNERTYEMLNYYLKKEIDDYQLEYAQLSQEEKRKRLVDENQIKEAVRKRLREQEEKQVAVRHKYRKTGEGPPNPMSNILYGETKHSMSKMAVSIAGAVGVVTYGAATHFSQKIYDSSQQSMGR